MGTKNGKIFSEYKKISTFGKNKKRIFAFPKDPQEIADNVMSIVRRYPNSIFYTIGLICKIYRTSRRRYVRRFNKTNFHWIMFLSKDKGMRNYYVNMKKSYEQSGIN